MFRALYDREEKAKKEEDEEDPDSRRERERGGQKRASKGVSEESKNGGREVDEESRRQRPAFVPIQLRTDMKENTCLFCMIEGVTETSGFCPTCHRKAIRSLAGWFGYKVAHDLEAKAGRVKLNKFSSTKEIPDYNEVLVLPEKHHQSKFYYNPFLGKSSWTQPKDSHVIDDLAFPRPYIAAYGAIMAERQRIEDENLREELLRR